MILSPPFLPIVDRGLMDIAAPDPLMDAVDRYELPHHGIYPIAFDRRWHCGVHLNPGSYVPVRAIADGEVVAYSVRQQAISDGYREADGTERRDSNTGFVLLRHTTETGEGRVLTFYSLYMHLLDLDNTRDKVNPTLKEPPEIGSATVLPRWLSYASHGVKIPDRLTVRRKDILGYPGLCNGHQHVHFEIFMTEADFSAWFDQTANPIQLGLQNPTTPTSKDHWGHSYFVIPGGSVFVNRPPGQATAQAGFFPNLQAGELAEGSQLYVESYFHKGQRYTRCWREKDGKVTCLTGDRPAADPYPDYEYNMYSRARALYPACPSDGYELLRFGRILSDEPTLPVESRKTWVSITFEQGKQGYIDLNQSVIQKLSDADFPRFMGWQKIDEGNTPFSDDVQCDLTELRHFVQYVEDRQTPEQRLRPGFEQEDRLALYIQDNPEVRARLRGFICHAPSEWDASGNDVRYKRLNDPDGFYGKRRESDPDGYGKFIRFLTKFQFLEKTPLGVGRKFWFFHPLAFIRHFRRCGWLSRTELAATFPKHLFYTSTGNPRTAIAKKGVVYTLTRDQALERISTYVGVLNRCSRKYMGSDSQRMSLFLAQALWETAQWRNLGGMRRIFHEWGFGRFAKENPATEHYSAFYGRGIMQLTWAGNYQEYGEYCAIGDHVGPYMERLTPGAPRIKSDSRHYTFHPEDNGQLLQWAPRYDPDIVGEKAFHACESGGFYWVSKRFSLGMNMNRVADLPYSAGNVAWLNRLVNGGGNGFYERQAYTVFIMDKLCDEIPPENTIIVNRAPRANVLPCTTPAL